MSGATESTRPRVLQLGELSGIGGVEQKIRFYLRDSAARGRLEHHLLVKGRRIHHGLRDDVHASTESVLYGKYVGGVKLPKWPGILRRANFARQVRRVDPDVVMVWNRFGEADLLSAIRAESGAPIVHCECGGAWYERSQSRADSYLGHVATVVCASHACRRVLELRWGWSGDVAAEINGLRPDCREQSGSPKRIDPGGPVKLGVAARVSPRKGICLAVHALGYLRASGCEAQLHVAGNAKGRTADEVPAVVRELGLSDHVVFHGIVADMAGFFNMIDVFLCPSLREPFGSVCVEAACFGCVVIATQVDGLVEAVADGVTGYCVEPELPLAQYPQYGGALERLPEFVYDPVSDSIVEPRICDPKMIAGRIVELSENPTAFERMSAAGMERARRQLHFDHFVEALDGALQSALDSKSGSAVDVEVA